MAETYGAALDEMRDLLARQVAAWRGLLEATREGTDAVRTQDPDAFDDALAAQVDALARLRNLETERGELLAIVGRDETEEIARLKLDLKALAVEVSRANDRSRFVIERNGALVEARLGLHRRAGTLPDERNLGLHRIA
ncbi:MAG: flagellar export chaperone FlgN [bacterium]